MKQKSTLRSHALGLLIAASALPASAYAQEVTPPTIVAPTPEPAPTVAPAPAPAEAATPAPVFAPPSPVVQAVPPRAPFVPEAEAPAAEQPAASAPARRAARPAPRTIAQRAAPATAPAAAAAAIPAASAPAPAPEAVAPAVEPAAPTTAEAAPAPADDLQVTTEPRAESTTPWSLIGLGAIIVLGLLAFLFARRRRSRTAETVYEPQYEAAAAEPVALMQEPALAVPAAAVVAPAPVAERPWIELGMRPVRASTSADNAVVEVELTIDNSSNIAAHDIRISTWMLSTNAETSDAELALIDPPVGTQIASVDLEPGAEQTVSALLTVPKNVIGADADFRPVVVADARYPLPDGGEGRISASFEIGATNGGDTLDPIDVDGTGATDDIDARLHGTLERA